MQSRPPILWNPDARLIVLDMDDTLSSSTTIGDPIRRTFYPQSIKRILELAKTNRHVHVVIASSISPSQEIKASLSAICNIDHANIRIHGEETMRNQGKSNFDLIDELTRELGVHAERVAWVDDSFDDIFVAARKGYNPVLVPSYFDNTRQLRIQSSDYLDCLPAIIELSDRNEYLNRIRNLGINNVNRYSFHNAQQLVAVYRSTLARHQLFNAHHASAPLAPPRKQQALSNEEIVQCGKLNGARSPKVFFDSILAHLTTVINYFEAKERAQRSAFNFFGTSLNETAEIIDTFKKAHSAAVQFIEPDKLEKYETLGKELLKVIIVLKQRHLNYPRTENGRQMLATLNDIINLYGPNFILDDEDSEKTPCLS